MKAYDTSSAARCHLGQAWESLQAAWPTLRWERSVFSFLLSRFGSSNPGEQETMKKRTFEFAIKTRPRSLSQHGTISQIGKKCRDTSSHAIFVRKLFFICSRVDLGKFSKTRARSEFWDLAKDVWVGALLSLHWATCFCGSKRVTWKNRNFVRKMVTNCFWKTHVAISAPSSGICRVEPLMLATSNPFCGRIVQMLEQMFFSTYFDLFRCFAQHLHPTSGSPGWSASITGPGTPGAQIPLSSNGFGCQQIPSSPFTRERRPFCKWLLWRSRELKRSKLTKIIQEWNKEGRKAMT